MNKFFTENFRFKITVIEAGGCRNGHEVGDTYTCEYGCPGDFCSKSMAKLFPLLEAVRSGGSLSNLLYGATKYSGKFTCPDGVVHFELEAFDKAEIAPISTERLSEYAEVVSRSFATVAEDFGLTKENAPGHISFSAYDRLRSKIKDGYYPYGLFLGDKVFGFVSLTDVGNGAYELNQLAVLPGYRHCGYGKKLLDFCQSKVREFGGNKIVLDIIEENTRLKDWYAANGFVHTGTKKFEHLPFTTGYMERRVHHG
jgi:uncharacterized repeat protein (TIGR04076 family)